MIKIGASLRNLRDRIRASVNVKPDNILFFMALSLVVIVAIMIRLTPILRGPLLIKAFDPWIQYYNAKYISEHSLYEYFHWRDKKSWYPEGKNRPELRPGLPFTAVIIYKTLTFFGVPVTLYEVCYFFPAFMGGLTVLAAYFRFSFRDLLLPSLNALPESGRHSSATAPPTDLKQYQPVYHRPYTAYLPEERFLK